MSKLINKAIQSIALLVLGFLPWGQVPSILLSVHPIDILALVSLPISAYIYIVRRKSLSSIPFLNFAFVAAFTFLLSLASTPPEESITGFLYLFRFISYISLAAIFLYSVEERLLDKSQLIKSLLLVGVVMAVLGWTQYLLMPDLRFMKILGWDDHYFRLVSTFLDPTFTGLMLTLATIIALKKRKFTVSVFLIITILFTYSRASYLSLVAGIIYLFWKKLNTKVIFTGIALIFATLLILPKPQGEGGKLARLSTVYARIRNSSETIKIYKKNPLFGVGFNNICHAKKQLDPRLKSINSCHGADNSFLLILATMGTIGGIVFFHSSRKLLVETTDDLYGEILKASSVALAVHSLFGNSIFYISVMAWFAIQIAVSRKP